MISKELYGKNAACVSFGQFAFDANTGILHSGRAPVYSAIDCTNPVTAIPLYINNIADISTHANIILVDKKNTVWIIERFDAYGGAGKDIYLSEKIDEALKVHFDRFLKPRNILYDYISPIQSCPRIGLLSTNDGAKTNTCQIWNLFYLHSRLRHSDIQPHQLLTELLALPSEKLTEILQDYVSFIEETSVPESFIEFQNQKDEAALRYNSLEDYIDNTIRDNIAKVTDKTTLKEKLSIVEYMLYIIAKCMFAANDAETVLILEGILFEIQKRSIGKRLYIIDTAPAVTKLFMTLQGKILSGNKLVRLLEKLYHSLNPYEYQTDPKAVVEILGNIEAAVN